MTGIEDKLGAPIGQLSRGYRQRVGIADALLGSPPLLILDEPTVGLDPNQVRDIRAMLRSLGGSHTLVFSSHILAEVESLCDRVVILAQGKVVADESLDEALAAGVIEVRLGCPRLRAEAIVAGAWQKLGCDRAPAIHFDHRDLDPDEEPATGREPERGKGRDALDEGARAGQRKADSVGVRIVLERGGPLAADALRAVGQASHEAGVAVHELCEGKTRLERRFASVTTARADRS
jgi:ABC-2 type transport system ATP-binding protein